MTPYETLCAQVRADRVQIGVDIRRMNSPGSPVFSTLENVGPVGLGLIAVFAAHAIFGVWGGVVVLAVFLALWVGLILPRVRSRIYDRTFAMALQDESRFTLLWAWGAVFLHRDGVFCRAPQGDWREFVAPEMSG